ncbi:serine/threonine-protein kinase [Actinomadura macra]|uniref:serine/threonine-protein kinase n=1 Tax=Actinomadura macra TaxID=46164 RepID=UPI00082F6CB3|nr:tetratricopeptide repeat protein [Actinomadura macra]
MRIGGYLVLRTLGEDAMGVMYLATAPDDRAVVVRVLAPGIDETVRHRLGRVAAALRQVREPHIAEVLDADLDADLPYIVTRYVRGRTLEETVETLGPLGGRDLWMLAAGLASAMAALHRAGIVHHDMTPGNVLMTSGGPMIVGVGLGLGQFADSTRLTATGIMIGSTGGYLAPEIIEGGASGPPSDVHAWAGTLAYAATGRPPFGSGPFESILLNIMRGTPDLDGVPDAMLPMLRSAMAKAPADRPTADALVRMTGDADDDLDLDLDDEWDTTSTRTHRAPPAVRPGGDTGPPEGAGMASRPAPIPQQPYTAPRPRPASGIIPPFSGRGTGQSPWRSALMALVLILACTAGVVWSTRTGRSWVALAPIAIAAVIAMVYVLAVRLRRWRITADHRRVGRRNAEALRLIGRAEYGAAETALRDLVGSLAADDPQAVIARNNLGVALRGLGRPEAADTALSAALENSSADVGRRVRANLAALRFERGLAGPDQLRASLSAAASGRPADAVIRGNLAVALHGAGRLEKAARDAAKALETAVGSFGPDDARTLALQANLGAVQRDLGEPERAEALLRESFERSRAILGGDHPQTLVAQAGLAALLADRGRLDEALARLREVRDVRIRTLGPGHPATLRAGTNLGFLYLRDGDLHQAETIFAAVLDAEGSAGGLEQIMARAREGLARARP